ncbi:MAG: 2-amino-4-hydroxy-6-hydroxymethyldihydropteridine diphosphokinase [Prevotella histicola]|uniref:2-amino-4-hydroxy-6- hydroxymethyldihydropteridine diphosphokinase n=1 Tax=Prevotella histicola TaxID=470565 RepID=UPI00241EA17F|nr:2-amino-4-hydroxy-6-hydroxymethyldihydropteridine diphosphokinase [Prevotella histicola]MBS5897614.1 2-amino-4-hydroxy-6-hydroxymethyldihydropteridine diphosphokinase [Prevotella histicola]
MHTVYLALGTNLGNRKAIMREAINNIGKKVGTVMRQSSFYETEPWGFESPNLFLNACICVSTKLAPRQLLEVTQAIERDMGRIEKTVGLQYVDRIIDIDILLYDDLHINEPDLVIPHPLMEEREFVMKPLLEIKE